MAGLSTNKIEDKEAQLVAQLNAAYPDDDPPKKKRKSTPKKMKMPFLP